jgi:hypothetical protein
MAVVVQVLLDSARSYAASTYKGDEIQLNYKKQRHTEHACGMRHHQLAEIDAATGPPRHPTSPAQSRGSRC